METMGALSGAAGGMADAVAGIIEQRMNQARLAATVAQSQATLAETQRAHMADEANRATQLQNDLAYKNEMTADRQFKEHQILNESMPPGTQFPASSPAASYLSSIPSPVQAEAPPDALAATPGQGPSDLPGTIANAPSPVMGRLLTKTPTFNQQKNEDVNDLRRELFYNKIANAPKGYDAYEQRAMGLAEQNAGRPLTLAEQQKVSDAARQKWGADNRVTVGINGTPSQQNARLDKSYQFNDTQLEKLAAPLATKADRLRTLAEGLNQHNIQADALVAPELLSIMAGGANSGLRMNDAEISRIVGGRPNWDSIKAAVSKWQLDPNKAFSISEDQRKWIGDLLTAQQNRLGQKVNAVNDARSKLINANDVTEHRKTLDGLQRQLSTIDSGNASATDLLNKYFK